MSDVTAVDIPRAGETHEPINKPKPEAPKPQPVDRRSRELLNRISSLDGKDPERVLREVADIPNSSLIVDVSPENVSKAKDLKDPSLVGKDKYGEGLVNKHHKGKNDLSEHEEAQKQAYRDLQQKIDAGLIDPKMIGTEVCLKLEASPDLENIPKNYDEISVQVNKELQEFRDKGKLTEEELQVITKEVVEFTNLYGKAYGKEDIAKAYELARDNARKLLYQHVVDKDVFSGSDHGFRHIINGNIRFAEQMIGSLREKGVMVSAKDQIILHQVMIDHDLGYTTGAAQSPKGFEASKDHPLVSARFIEDNKSYYIDKFGEEGFEAIHDSVLNHTYPRLEYRSDGQENVHKGLIRGISSTVDSLGVTVETKTPEFFWNKDAMRTLLKIRLSMETMGGKVPEDLMGKYKQELFGVADKEVNVDRRVGYRNAIQNFFNEFTAENTLGHYTGVVRNVKVEEVSESQHHDISDNKDEHGHEGSDKRFRVVVEMTPTEVYALLGNMFGDKLAAQSFAKEMKDLGLNTEQLEAHARAFRRAIARRETKQPFGVKSDNARVVIGDTFLEEQELEEMPDILDAVKIKTIVEVFREVEILSMRTEINELLDAVGEKGVGVIPEIRARFESSISTKMNASEIEELNGLLINLSDSSLSGEKDSGGKDITVSQAARDMLKVFRTVKENKFLGIN